jgi:hypothetical protein
MLKPSVLILQLSEGIGLRVLLGVFIYVKKNHCLYGVMCSC